MGDSDKASTTSSVKGIMKRQVVIGEGGGVSISRLSLRLSYLSAGLKTPNLMSLISPFTGIAFPMQQRECLISWAGAKVRMWQWLSDCWIQKRVGFVGHWKSGHGAKK